MLLKVFFKQNPDYDLDRKAREIFESVPSKSIGSGTDLQTMIRDIEYDVPDIVASSIASRLIAAGFKVDCP